MKTTLTTQEYDQLQDAARDKVLRYRKYASDAGQQARESGEDSETGGPFTDRHKRTLFKLYQAEGQLANF